MNRSGAVGMVLVASMSAGCGAPQIAKPDQPVFVDATGADAATIRGRLFNESTPQGTDSNGLPLYAYVSERFIVHRVDGRLVSRGFLGRAEDAEIKVPPGSRQLLIRVEYSRDDGFGRRDAYVPLEVTLKPSTSYDIGGRSLPTRRVEVWLEETATKTRVSEIRSQGASVMKEPPTLYFPVKR